MRPSDIDSGSRGALVTCLDSCTETAPGPGGIQERQSPRCFLPPELLRPGPVQRTNSAHLFTGSPRDVPMGPPLWVCPLGDPARPPGAELGLASAPAPWSLPARPFQAGAVRAPAPLLQSSVYSFPTSKTPLLPGSRREEWAGVGEDHLRAG